ncbi:ORF MSV007 hypothetical protein [Melanoplus sanguinipes entomopoxvirus]|uniref:Uncharacterized protein n=1 Tax=Melanoplus sanguinipes entomopoxvirus TaxID=83191 RepID=Q9YW84_MSEPV|nr:ORF MSV007 hypothetical protein [Melanoplus sanguinipes entomopoxvirus]AAC97609.1 ORF MSV007 hypothetical protein [Melanoplus sanguinipes entomopoxvirus 'O']
MYIVNVSKLINRSKNLKFVISQYSDLNLINDIGNLHFDIFEYELELIFNFCKLINGSKNLKSYI